MNRRTRRLPFQGGKTSGFTLIELLLVLVILSLIGALVLPNIIGKGEKANVKAAANQITRLSMSVDEFYLDTGRMPETLTGLVEEPQDVSGWNGPYVKGSALKDPWGRDYQFRNPGQHGPYDIFSYGSDGQQGGEENAADITSWE